MAKSTLSNNLGLLLKISKFLTTNNQNRSKEIKLAINEIHHMSSEEIDKRYNEFSYSSILKYKLQPVYSNRIDVKINS